MRYRIHTCQTLTGTEYTIKLPSGKIAAVDVPDHATWRDIEEIVVFLRSLVAVTVSVGESDPDWEDLRDA